MKILMVSKYYPPHVGGIEFHLQDISEGLVKAGHKVVALVCNGENELKTETINGVEIIRLPRLFEKASTPVSREFKKALDVYATDADIVHFHFPYPYGEFEWLRTKAHCRQNKPYVVTYHTDIVRQKLALELYRPFLNIFLNGAARIIASSPQLIKYSEFLNTRTDKARQLNFGLPVEEIAYHKGAKKRAEELKAHYNNRPLVLFVGRLVYYKGVEVLARSIKDVDAEFIVIGKGDLKDAMVKIAREDGFEKRLHFIDYADRDELIAWFHAADVLALPSVLPSEAFGLVQIEAHAAATPTVSTLLKSGVPYANLDGVTGLSVKPYDHKALADALNQLLNNKELHDKYAAQAQKRALKDFNVQQMVDNTIALYKEVLKERSLGA